MLMIDKKKDIQILSNLGLLKEIYSNCSGLKDYLQQL